MDLTRWKSNQQHHTNRYPQIGTSAVITDTEKKPTKAMNGSYLQLTIEVIEGQHAGRKVFDRLNLS
jgi:hypothetical protein